MNICSCYFINSQLVVSLFLDSIENVWRFVFLHCLINSWIQHFWFLLFYFLPLSLYNPWGSSLFISNNWFPSHFSILRINLYSRTVILPIFKTGAITRAIRIRVREVFIMVLLIGVIMLMIMVLFHFHGKVDFIVYDVLLDSCWVFLFTIGIDEIDHVSFTFDNIQKLFVIFKARIWVLDEAFFVQFVVWV